MPLICAVFSLSEKWISLEEEERYYGEGEEEEVTHAIIPSRAACDDVNAL